MVAVLSLSLTRLIVFASSSLLSLIVLGLAGHVISLTEQYFGTGIYFNFTALAVATAVLHLVTIPVFVVIDFLRAGAFTSMILVELSWVFVLMVLWLATAADSASAIGNANCNLFYDLYKSPCQQMQAIEAFAFLNWLLVLGYGIMVLVFAVNATSNGRQPWMSSVKELKWSGNGDGSAEMRGIHATSPSGHHHADAGGLKASQQPTATTV